MKLKIEITMDNAAFDNNQGAECAHILGRLAEALRGLYDLTGFKMDLADFEGQTVGSAKVTK